MRKLAVIATFALTIAACGVSDDAPRSGAMALTGAAAPSRKVIVVTETSGYHHASIPWAVDALRHVAERDRRYQVVLLPSATKLTPRLLSGAAAVVFLLTTGELPLSGPGKRALVSFVHNGGGLVGFHSATDTFHRWSGYLDMIGAEFSHHPPPSSQRVIVEDRSTPATRKLPTRFVIHEEFYVFRHNPRARVHVLARLDTRHGRPDRPLAWCRQSGAGRVFYDALGHFPETWLDPRQLALVSGGIAWAAGFTRAPSCQRG